jgi:hypothetical protein
MPKAKHEKTDKFKLYLYGEPFRVEWVCFPSDMQMTSKEVIKRLSEDEPTFPKGLVAVKVAKRKR